ncbi:MAG: oligosaccharide flippase family protein [Bacteroidota bacterium]|nr:oligosaccharide flippase family protein [Bacteroidota bacterium]
MPSLTRNIIANYLGRSWSALLSFILVPFYLKYLGIEAYGLVGFFTSLSGMLGILDFGIGATMNRELARYSAKEGTANKQKDLVRTLELIYWGIAIIAGIIVFLVASFIANSWLKIQVLSPNSALTAIKFMGVAIALNFPISLYQGGLMGLQRQVLVNIILTFIGTLRGIGAILVLWLVSPTIEAFFIWQAISSLVGSVAFYISIWICLSKSQKKAKFNISILKGIWKYALAISTSSIIGIILSQLDKIILSKMLTLKMFGYYSLAATFASSIWMIIIPYVNALFPRLVQLNELSKTQNLKSLFHHSSQLLSLLLFPIVAIFVCFSHKILLLWTNDPIIAENSYLIVDFLVLGIMLNGTATLPSNCATAFGWPTLVTYTNLIQAIIIVPLIIIMVNWMRGIGASIAWLVMNSTYIIFMVPIFFRSYLTHEKLKWYLNDIGIPLITAFLVCLISLIIEPHLHAKSAIIIWILITLLISFFATGMSLSFIRRFVYNHFFK